MKSLELSQRQKLFLDLLLNTVRNLDQPAKQPCPECGQLETCLEDCSLAESHAPAEDER